eukprot:m.104812 g.104812  ORF g.104812 m.104812 type:complete len:660 (+) comp15769_c0_seq2:1921-3900(+)
MHSLRRGLHLCRELAHARVALCTLYLLAVAPQQAISTAASSRAAETDPPVHAQAQAQQAQAQTSPQQAKEETVMEAAASSSSTSTSTLTSTSSPPLFLFDNSYAKLPARFYARLAPSPVKQPSLVKLNERLACELGLDARRLASPEGVAVLAGNTVAPGSEPLAQAYAGHQFGGLNPQLGDGRAILLGELLVPSSSPAPAGAAGAAANTAAANASASAGAEQHIKYKEGQRVDVQLKGSGKTPYSRGGDGRAAIGPVLREYIVSEAMYNMGVPTTRSLAAVATGQHVFREFALPGAVLTRVAASHVRVGTFQFFALRNDQEAVRTLADFVRARHYPEAASALDMFKAVVRRQADLIARWMLVGFVHGVMNTDNCAVSGETIDYGPCAFMEAYHPDTVFSSIDHGGRYAYANQPRIAMWNLARLAETLLPLFDPEDDAGAIAKAQQALEAFMPQYETTYWSGMARKIGLNPGSESGSGSGSGVDEADRALIEDLLDRMELQQADFTLTFRLLADAAEGEAGAEADAKIRKNFMDPSSFDEWAVKWRARLAKDDAAVAASPPSSNDKAGDEAAAASESSSGSSGERRRARAAAMRAVNPLYIPRNHIVEQALEAAIKQDYSLFEELLSVLANPYVSKGPEFERYTLPAKPEERVLHTFCGT